MAVELAEVRFYRQAYFSQISGIQAVNMSYIRIPSGSNSGGHRIYICCSMVEGTCMFRKYRTNLQFLSRWESEWYSERQGKHP